MKKPTMNKTYMICTRDKSIHATSMRVTDNLDNALRIARKMEKTKWVCNTVMIYTFQNGKVVSAKAANKYNV